MVSDITGRSSGKTGLFVVLSGKNLERESAGRLMDTKNNNITPHFRKPDRCL